MDRTEPIAAQPGRVGRVMAHDSLVKQVSERRQAHGRTGVAGTHLLNRIGGEQTSRVDGSSVEVRPPTSDE